MFFERIDPDALDGFVVAVQGIELAAALGVAEILPVGRSVAGTGEARFLDEGFQQHGAIGVAGPPEDECLGLISERYERATAIVPATSTSASGAEPFSNGLLATAIFDRLLHTAICFKGRSYRLCELEIHPRRHLLTHTTRCRLTPEPATESAEFSRTATLSDPVKSGAALLRKTGFRSTQKSTVADKGEIERS